MLLQKTIDPSHKWHLNLNGNTLYILNFVLLFILMILQCAPDEEVDEDDEEDLG